MVLINTTQYSCLNNYPHTIFLKFITTNKRIVNKSVTKCLNDLSIFQCRYCFTLNVLLIINYWTLCFNILIAYNVHNVNLYV